MYIHKKIIKPFLKEHFNLKKYFTLKKLLNEATKEVNRFQEKKNKINNIIIIHDNYLSPPTIGDFLYIILAARFFSKLDMNVIIYLTNDKFRSDWSSLINENKEQQFVKQQIELIDKFCNNNNVKSIIITSNEKYNILKNNKNDFILFQQYLENMHSIYSNMFNFLNIIYYKYKEKDFLFNEKEFNLSDIKFNKNKYIAFHCRYNQHWDSERNMNENSFFEILNKFKNEIIIIVSDERGCIFYKKLLNNNYNNSNIFFSKDFTNSFFEDAKLCINSSLYIQYRGGGIGLIPMFAINTPYLIFDYGTTEYLFQKNTACAWANQNQIRKFSNNYSEFISILNSMQLKKFV
jgi:hypothetical protein